MIKGFQFGVKVLVLCRDNLIHAKTVSFTHDIRVKNPFQILGQALVVVTVQIQTLGILVCHTNVVLHRNLVNLGLLVFLLHLNDFNNVFLDPVFRKIGGTQVLKDNDYLLKLDVTILEPVRVN